ncbi:ABC transporter permease [Marinobacter sp.]|uniref:ABC transporter permease n=1 Tax=Marinobacter sp. TaxID=50741 RepID=UPI003562F549
MSLPRLLTPFAGMTLLVIGWWLLARQIPESILPGPGPVLNHLVSALSRATLWRDTAVTLTNVTASFVIAMTGGTLLGLWAASSPLVERLLHPVIVIVEAAPTIAWLVLAILWLGLGAGPPILVGVSMALPLIVIATSHGLRQIDAGLMDMAHVYGLSRWIRLTRILLPSLALTLAGAASGALSVAWRGIIMAEAFSASQGLGPSLWGSYLYGEINDVYAVILWIIVLGLALEYLLVHPARQLIRRRLDHE